MPVVSAAEDKGHIAADIRTKPRKVQVIDLVFDLYIVISPPISDTGAEHTLSGIAV
jgi:hypothetical protein